MTCRTIYVALTLAAKGGGAKIGAERVDIGIETPGLSYEDYRAAETAAVAQFASAQGVHTDRVYVLGLYSAGI